MNGEKQALKHYRNPFFTHQEFLEDYKRIKWLIRCFDRTESFQTRLAYNHYIISCNCFGVEFVEDEIRSNLSAEGMDRSDEFLSILKGSLPRTEFGSRIFQDLKGVL